MSRLVLFIQKKEEKTMKLPDKVYDILKWVMLLAVPVSTFIIGIYQAVLTGDPVAIILAICGGLETLIGVILKISDSFYKKELNGG